MKINQDKFSLFQMASLVDDWKQKYHVNNKHEVIFQNKDLLSNVRFPNGFMHKNHSPNRGFSNLPETIQNPSEVWSLWKDPKSQKDVIRNYILKGKEVNYVVSTLNGVIQSAKIVVTSKLNRIRKGVIILRK
jgi:hypothetical protein